ncbi:hypothetical protein AYL99_06011 [Fonsecaea erecta]|uniref:F-box domain-containing protein n=1 Tax=Fonsecaea erecta TaxID=1367422 RepID=A0A178ZMJ1_9EURO|nr:hypothetical protein AYL99_06011 [Fonsecaea erecta]OAP61007.1 hypothetical protein AYL99_06011 [Fonsecaea erecta]
MASLVAKPLEPASLTPNEFRFLSKKPDYNKVIIDAEELRRRIWLSEPQRWTTTRRQCRTGLGNLDKLPREVQIYIFGATAINDLLNLRATNSHAKQLIEQWEPFRAVMTHGRDAVRALLATGAGYTWTVPQLVDVLFISECEFCGQHGEILHLLRLKRCCFRCLSQERELLAVNLGYAQCTMGLSQAELRKLPQLVTVPQRCFWGFPAQSGYIFDYKAAMDVLRQKGPRASISVDREGPPSYNIPLIRTGLEVDAEQRSIQQRPKSSIQARRRQQPLRLLDEELSPPETTYAQHACAIRVPSLRCQSERLVNGFLQTTVSTIEVVHCAGCAYFWNYHSALPWQFHQLYSHQLETADSEFNEHLRHCVYARLLWRWIHNPLHPRAREGTERILKTFRLSYLPRHSTFNGEDTTALFERIPNDVVLLMHSSDHDFTSFSPECTWPELKNDDDEEELPIFSRKSHAIFLQIERMRAIALRHPIDKRDYYWDCLISQDAVSQANWACANVHNGSVSLFRGPASILGEKKRLFEKKFRVEGRPLGRLPQWGFGHFYL